MARLLGIAAVLWREALSKRDGTREDVERAIRCLYAGLELVLPTALEVRFRLMLAQLLQLHTGNAVEACEHIRKSLQLLNTRMDCPMKLKFLATSMWCTTELAASEKSQMKHLMEARQLAIGADELEWWMHFDWLAWRMGLFAILKDSLHLIMERKDTWRYRLFLLVLLSFFDNSLVKGEISPELNTKRDESTSTMEIFAALLCLKEAIEQGETAEARSYYDRYITTIHGCDGELPGFIQIDPNTVRDVWARLAAILSVRVGETPTLAVIQIIPDIVSQMRMLTKVPAMELISDYEGNLSKLLEILTKSKTDAKVALDECKSITVNCPQFESFRHLVMAVCQFHADQPVHHTKSSLLAALKVLNGTTHNAQLKVIVLILVGYLYLDTDFGTAVKMSTAAHTLSSSAKWDFWALIAAEQAAIAHKLLGNEEESLRFASLANQQQMNLDERAQILLTTNNGI
jgi:hypothetical protein